MCVMQGAGAGRDGGVTAEWFSSRGWGGVTEGGRHCRGAAWLPHLSPSSLDRESHLFCSSSANSLRLNLELGDFNDRPSECCSTAKKKKTDSTNQYKHCQPRQAAYLTASCLTSRMNCFLTQAGPCSLPSMSHSCLCCLPGRFTSL